MYQKCQFRGGKGHKEHIPLMNQIRGAYAPSKFTPDEKALMWNIGGRILFRDSAPDENISTPFKS